VIKLHVPFKFREENEHTLSFFSAPYLQKEINLYMCLSWCLLFCLWQQQQHISEDITVAIII
jgi:hypothetical protein